MYRNIHARPSQLAALPAAAPTPAVQPIVWDMSSGSIIYTAPGAAPMKIPVIPGILSAVLVKTFMFGSKKLGTYAVTKAKAHFGR